MQQKSVEDDATDSGYGGSIIEGSSSDSESLFGKSFSTGAGNWHDIAGKRQEEIYQENCRLLTEAIEDTKHILKVKFL